MPKPRLLLDWIGLDAGESMPLYRQLYSEIRTGILSGRLTAGNLLPSSRMLAAELDVSRNTVINAYDQLIAEGYLETSAGSATSVAAVLPSTSKKRAEVAKATTMPLLSRRALRLQKSQVQVLDLDLPDAVAFTPGVPAFDEFPVKVWSRLLADHAHKMHPELADNDAYIGGYGPLREALASYLRTSRMVDCGVEQVLVVSSARAGLDIICRLLANAGDYCLVEEPGYNTAKEIMKSAGLNLLPVTVDEEGMSISSTTRSDSNPRLAYVTPSHQWPMGFSLSANRRQQLLEWANRQNAWVVEDDYDSEFRFDSRPLATLQGLDGGKRVIYLGTFSKTLFPSLRIGYVVVPHELTSVFRQSLFYAGQEPPLHIQAALAQFIQDGFFFSHIRKMRRVYRRRQANFVDALRRYLTKDIPVARPPGGMQLVLNLPKELKVDVVSLLAANVGLHARPISMYALTEKAPNALHLGFAAVPDKRIRSETRKLASAIDAAH